MFSTLFAKVVSKKVKVNFFSWYILRHLLNLYISFLVYYELGKSKLKLSSFLFGLDTIQNQIKPWYVLYTYKQDQKSTRYEHLTIVMHGTIA